MVEYTGSGEIDLSVLEAADVIDVNTLKKFLDNFALGMNCAAVSVDREGNEITAPSYYRSYCQDFIHKSPTGDSRCAECHNRMGEEAAKTGKPFVGPCHAGLTDFAAPIIVNGQHLGTVLVYRPLNKWTIYPNYDIIPSRTYSWRFIMGRTASSIELSIEDRKYLESQMRARTIQAQTVERARILILKADGKPIDDIAALIGMNRKSVMLCLKKYKEGGVENALFDAPGRGRNAEITDDEKTWIINIACKKPTDFGYAAETWTYAKLTAHVNLTAEASGYTRLSTVNKSTVHKILDDAEIKPFRINYYCEQRDPDFDRKMHNVLLVYKQLSMQFDKNGQLVPFEDDEAVHVLSYDEKPGVQAISTTSDDLLPNGSNGAIQRDYEYKRLGTVSLLTAIDLQTGEAIPLVSETHNSKDYIKFLRILDDKYPAGDKIRIVLDNLKVHTSVETRRFLATLPGRFEFVFTPKHGSWLNLVEGFFSKMTRQMLRGIRVKTKEELISRIHRYFDEVNEHPVVYHWKYKLDDVDITEEIGTDTLLLEQSS